MLKEKEVYLINETGTNNYKIGVARDSKARLKTLQTGNSKQLELIKTATFPNAFRIEKQIHNIVRQHKIKGEWFQLEPWILTKVLEQITL